MIQKNDENSLQIFSKLKNLFFNGLFSIPCNKKEEWVINLLEF